MGICWVLWFLKPTGLGLTDTARYILQCIDREFVPVAWNLQTLDDQCQSKIWTCVEGCHLVPSINKWDPAHHQKLLRPLTLCIFSQFPHKYLGQEIPYQKWWVTVMNRKLQSSWQVMKTYTISICFFCCFTFHCLSGNKYKPEQHQNPARKETLEPVSFFAMLASYQDRTGQALYMLLLRSPICYLLRCNSIFPREYAMCQLCPVIVIIRGEISKADDNPRNKDNWIKHINEWRQ